MDLIDRQALLLRLADWQLQESPNWGANGMGDAKVYETLKGVEEMIQELPTIEPKKGKWEVVDEEEPRWYGCSLCEKMARWPYNYCPNCGAKLERSEE